MLALLLLVASDRGGAGHQVAHYPSYYPDEIRISAVSPAEAAVGLSARTLHAYVGATPQFAGPVPAHVKPVTSLASFLVLAFDSASARFASAEARCSAGRSVLAALSREKAAGFVFHPYPVTPYHADYLHHLDRIEAAKNALAERSASPGPLKIAAKGPLAEAIVRNVWGEADVSGDLMLEVVPIDAPLISAGALGGWSAAPWIKQGWFQAHWLLAPALDPARRSAADDDHGRLTHGDVSGLAEHADLERRLVASLTQGCERMVVGYAVRQEFLTDAYPEGIENVGYDSLSGIGSPLFVRTD